MDPVPNYKDYPETSECYLDGRYFNLVLAPLHKGVSLNPLMIDIEEDLDGNASYIRMHMHDTVIRSDTSSIIRVIIRSASIRHSALLVINTADNNVWFWNPKSNYHIKTGSDGLEKHIIHRIRGFLKVLGGMKFTEINYPIDEEYNSQCLSQGYMSGYCNAYIIKFVIDWINNRTVDLTDIRRFVSAIEHKYSSQLTGEPDIEFSTKSGTLIGGLVGGGAGVLIGGAIGGPIGAIGGGLIGGGAGMLAGGAIGSHYN